ncbi:hypothetical protein [Erythrobacter sp. SG61-1L]|uniref:hypothetical protein n=1 Tax=Erythrobacter sp. SG61-1L TaxID=1603897 RepID=UPI0006C8EB46|nr:hypothetical protein [Erythrobacter sp. SG61-1L]
MDLSGRERCCSGALALLAALVLPACATAPAEQTVRSGGLNLADPVEQAALALAEADEAASAGEMKRLATAVHAIEASGAQPLADEPENPVPGWRSLAGISRPPLRGSPLGPGFRRGQLKPGETVSIEQLFLSGEQARVVLSAPARAPLALQVRDARSAGVCEREGTPNQCQWVPIFTQRYSIVISNRGQGPARYYLVVK